jgi:hypothetical protein
VAIVEDCGFLARLASVRPRLPQLRRVVLIDGEARAGEDWLISWGELLALRHDSVNVTAYALCSLPAS